MYTILPNHRLRYILLGLLVISCAVVILQQCFKILNAWKENLDPELLDLSCQTVRTMANKTKHCILQYAKESEDLWTWLLQAMVACSKEFRNEISMTELNETTEIDYILLQKSKSYTCNVLTFGIGDNVKNENSIKSLMPHCKFFGVDPDYPVGQKYDDIEGKYYPVAVGDKEGYFEMNVVKSGKITSKHRVYFLSLHQILKSINLNFVDYLFVDIGGFEYNLLESLANESIRICQINIEFHFPLEIFGISNKNATAMFTEFFANSPYVPLSIEKDAHVRMFLVDLHNVVCINKFFRHCNH